MATPETTLRLDRQALRVLAHPLRSRLLTSLRSAGPATATALALSLGTNTGATSYHLRKLASVGLVDETEEGRGRERWWRASTASHAWTERDVAGDPDAEAASDWLKRHYLQEFADRYERWLDQAAGWPIEWRAAAESGDVMLQLSPTRLAELNDELNALLERYRDRDLDDPDARPVAVYHHMFPTTSARGERP